MYNISANIICKNEKYWIEESILSIVDLVDEIIYVDDNSTDDSLEIVKKLAKIYNNIKIFEYKNHRLNNLGELKNFAVSKSKNEFILRWDADFIAYKDIDNLFEFCINNSKIYDGYILSGPNLSGDIFHQTEGRESFGPECYLFNKNKSMFISNERYPDYPHFQKEFRFCYPQKTDLNKNYFFIHTNNLKSMEKIAYRKKMCDYQLSGYEGTYWKWLHPNISEEDSKKIEIDRVRNSSVNLIEFNFKKWGKHPDLLLNSKSSKIFRIEENDDKSFRLCYPLN
jgi:glycosyltransferase involved in cell wall biosynthesis